MSLDSTEIRVAGSGHLYRAPAGTTLPTDSTTVLASAFKELGFAEDGFKMKQEIKTLDIAVWQKLGPARTIVQSLVRSFSFTLQQTNVETVELAWGGASVVPGSAGAYQLQLPDASAIAEFVLVAEWSDGDTNQRIIVPKANLLTLPELTFGRAGAVNYPLEITASEPGTTDAVIVYGVDDALAA